MASNPIEWINRHRQCFFYCPSSEEWLISGPTVTSATTFASSAICMEQLDLFKTHSSRNSICFRRNKQRHQKNHLTRSCSSTSFSSSSRWRARGEFFLAFFVGSFSFCASKQNPLKWKSKWLNVLRRIFSKEEETKMTLISYLHHLLRCVTLLIWKTAVIASFPSFAMPSSPPVALHTETMTGMTTENSPPTHTSYCVVRWPVEDKRNSSAT